MFLKYKTQGNLSKNDEKDVLHDTCRLNTMNDRELKTIELGLIICLFVSYSAKDFVMIVMILFL